MRTSSRGLRTWRDGLLTCFVVAGIVVAPGCKSRDASSQAKGTPEDGGDYNTDIALPDAAQGATKELKASVDAFFAEGGYTAHDKTGKAVSADVAAAGNPGDYFFYTPTLKGQSVPQFAMTMSLGAGTDPNHASLLVKLQSYRIVNGAPDVAEGPITATSFVIDPGAPSEDGQSGIIYQQNDMDRALQQFSNDTIDELSTPAGGANLADGPAPSSNQVTVNVGGMNVRLSLGTLLAAGVVTPFVVKYLGKLLLTVFVWEAAKFTVSAAFKVTKAVLLLPLKAPGGVTGKLIASAIWIGGIVYIGNRLWQNLQNDQNFKAGKALLAQTLPDLNIPQGDQQQPAPTNP